MVLAQHNCRNYLVLFKLACQLWLSCGFKDRFTNADWYFDRSDTGDIPLELRPLLIECHTQMVMNAVNRKVFHAEQSQWAADKRSWMLDRVNMARLISPYSIQRFLEARGLVIVFYQSLYAHHLRECVVMWEDVDASVWMYALQRSGARSNLSVGRSTSGAWCHHFTKRSIKLCLLG